MESEVYSLDRLKDLPPANTIYPEEEPFLRQMNQQPEDHLLLLVYADWLEERGDCRALFLRAMHRLRQLDEASPEYEPLQRYKEVLRQKISPEWQERIGCRKPQNIHATVDTCLEERFDFICSKQWNELQPTDQETVRFCNDCQKRVFYCTTLKELNNQAGHGRCVAMRFPTLTMTLGMPLQMDEPDELVGLLDGPVEDPSPPVRIPGSEAEARRFELPLSHLTLSRATRRRLKAAGFRRIGDLLNYSAAELLQHVNGFTEHSLNEVRTELEFHGLSLRDA